MVEKKVILCAVLAIAIGIATVIPMEYLMAAQTQSNAGVANAQVVSTPWFNVNVPYVYVNLDQSGSNGTSSWDGVDIQGIANFTLTPAGMSLQGADAKIEYYQFEIYSDQGPIVNMSYSVAVSIEKIGVPGVASTYYFAITGSGGNGFDFANGLKYNGIPNYNGYCSGGNVLYDSVGNNLPSGIVNGTFTPGVFSANILNYSGANANQVVTELRNAQTLYIDVTRICSVSYNGNVTVSTASSNQVLQHIVLTKEGNGFVYGTYTDGEAPFPMETP